MKQLPLPLQVLVKYQVAGLEIMTKSTLNIYNLIDEKNQENKKKEACRKVRK